MPASIEKSVLIFPGCCCHIAIVLSDAVRETGPHPPPSLSQMVANLFADLLKRRFGGRNMTKRVEEHEVVDRAVVSDGGHRHAGCLELACVRFAFVAQRVVL